MPVQAGLRINNGLSDTAVYALVFNSDNPDSPEAAVNYLFAGTQENGICLSTNYGSNWTQVNNGLTNRDVNTLAVCRNGPSGYNIFAGTWGSGIFLSTNNGSSWTQVNNGLSSLYVNTIIVSPANSGPIVASINNIFAGTLDGGVYLSTNNGSSWAEINNGLISQSVVSLQVSSDGSNLFAGTNGNGVYLSTNNGSNWTQINNGLTNQYIQSLALISYVADSSGTSSSVLFAGTNGGGVYFSTNNGSNWVQANNGLSNKDVLSLILSTNQSGNTCLFAGTDGEGIFWAAIEDLIKSVDVITNSADSVTLNSVFLDGEVYTGGSSCTVQIDYGTTSNYGAAVTASKSSVAGSPNIEVSAHLTGLLANTLYHYRLKVVNSNGIIYGTDSTFFTLPVWQQSSGLSTGVINSFVAVSSGINSSKLFASSWGRGVYLSTDNGSSWVPVNNGLKSTYVSTFAVTPNLTETNTTNLFAGTLDNGIYLSSNNGSTWSQVSIKGLTDTAISALAVIPNESGGSDLFVGTDNYWGGVYLLSNNGSSWNQLFMTGVLNGQISTFATSPNSSGGSNLFIGTKPSSLFNGVGVYRSTDNGLNWGRFNTGFQAIYVTSFATSITEGGDTNLFVGTYGIGGGVYLLKNNGSSWTQINNGLTNLFVNALALSPTGTGGSFLFAGTDGGGVYFSTDNGTTWNQVNNELINTNVLALFVSGNYLFVGTNGSGVYRASIADLKNITAITTDPATNIKPTSATLNGVVYPDGLNTTVLFDYGLTNSYGSTLPASQSPVTGSSNVNVSADLTGLKSNTLYHYRVRATNSEGTIFGNDNVFRPNLVYYPSSLLLSQSYSFGDFTQSTSYRLIGLPGNIDTPLSQFMTGTFNQDWNAYYDNGDTSNYLVKYDSSSYFRFKPGNGFWVISKNAVNLSQTVGTVLLTDNSYSIPLHGGWNIISNPFGNSIIWDSVISENSLSSNSKIYVWNAGWSTSELFSSCLGYYFYNSQNLSSLKLEYNPDTSIVKSPAKGLVVNNIDLKNSLKLTLSSGSKDTAFVIIAIDSTSSNNYDIHDVLIPPGDFINTGIALYNKNLSIPYKYMFKESLPLKTDGQIFNIEITDMQKEPITLKLDGINNFTGNEVYLLDKSNARLYNIKANNSISLNPVQEEEYQILIGDSVLIKTAEQEILPTEYQLYQNYPNPFNPTTTIEYSIPKTSVVMLKVYDLLGREVASLVNEQQPAGYYNVIFPLKGRFASGVYFYRLQAGNFSKVKKLLLLK